MVIFKNKVKLAKKKVALRGARSLPHLKAIMMNRGLGARIAGPVGRHGPPPYPSPTAATPPPPEGGGRVG